MKQFILFNLLCFCCAIGFAQVSGVVVDNNEQPLYGVTVSVKGTDVKMVTDVDGIFKLNEVAGAKTLVFTSFGFKTKQVAVNAPQNGLNIILFEGNELLQEVVVENRKNKFSRKKTAYVAKLPLRNIENSQVYNTVTEELLISQNVNNFEDALKNAVGVDKLWQSTGRPGDGAGFYAMRGFATQPQLVNGMPGVTNGFINPLNVERVEVIKGPSATLFGSTVSSYGGLINIVTKKPFKGTGGSISLGGGSFNFKKLAVDVNTTDSSTEKFSFRFNAGFQSEDSFQDAGFRESVFMAPSVSYEVNDRLTLNLSYELSSTSQTNPTFLFFNRTVPLAFNTIDELNYNPELSLTDDSISIKNPTQNYRGEIAYKITDNWSSQTLISGGKAQSKGKYTFLWNFADWSDPANPQTTPFFSVFAQNSDAETNSFDIQQNFTGDFKLGNVRNRLVVGVDYLETQNIDKSSDFATLNAIDIQGNVLQGLPTNLSSVNLVLAGAATSDINVNQNILSAYVSDVVNILPELSVMAGVRYDRFNYKGDKNTADDDATEYVKSTISPKFGVIYQPILNKVSVFANYQNGFNYVNPELAPVNIADPSAGLQLRSFDLENADQLEGGVKTNLFNNKLEATVSYYNITVSNKIIGFGPSKQQDGKVKSQGFELDINAYPVDGLNVRGGFAYNDSEIVETASDPSLIGQRFGEAGADITYNFWADYRFLEGAIKNFGITAGFNGASDYNTMEGYPNVGEFILPAYTVFNAGVYYDHTKFRVSFNVNNLTDETYYKGWSTVTPQQPRAFFGALTYKF
ncbi:TonB-dependent receptor [Tenacibaculum sp. M341]|uniref:TonB-dependent receptor n=1 Tax=Tenacibaculum sp. M341 TaxID=2530339 RepID=UPI00104A0357|nr:TonB-dependent receptor [Tenacibaculum sp. M341]TCI90371.1 TonB-dependent receptor [Tenacibaculum sp. M341]